MDLDPKNPTDHLTNDALFALALPAAGVPEALPAHLLECLRCARALADWKNAVRDLAERDENDLEKRTAEEWSAVEDSTLAAIRREGAPGRGRARTLSWALPVAASLLVFALLVAGRQSPAPEAATDTAGLSAQDQADDALLLDVDRLASGEESPGGWGALAPEPDPEAGDAAPSPEGRS